MKYPGGKNGAGVAQVIINQMPPHRVYIEPFLGSGAVFRLKRPAEIDIGIDLDPAAVRAVAEATRGRPIRPQLYINCALEWLKHYHAQGDEVIYCDPPYLCSVRSGSRPIYRYEFATLEQHLELLGILKRLPCAVMLSGYASDLYATELLGWRVVRYRTMTHRGPVWESLWCNFAEPDQLHDYSLLGADRRKRQDLRRKRERWLSRLSRMPILERLAILSAIDEWREEQAR